MTGADPTAEERQELLSICYVDAARIVGPLASGRFAVCAMARGHVIAMLPPEALHPSIITAAAESTRDYAANKAAEALARERRGFAPETIAVAANVEDLGL